MSGIHSSLYINYDNDSINNDNEFMDDYNKEFMNNHANEFMNNDNEIAGNDNNLFTAGLISGPVQMLENAVFVPRPVDTSHVSIYLGFKSFFLGFKIFSRFLN